MTRRERREFTVFGFASTHDALSAEETLKRAGVPVVPIPAPPTLGAQCGIAMRVEVEDATRAEEVLVGVGIGIASHSSLMDL